MRKNTVPVADEVALRRIVQELIATYDWALPQEDELMAWVLSSIRTLDRVTDWERLLYSVALYEACRQTADRERREDAYQELFRFLFRVARNRWPELADDATQRALVLIYEQLDRCRGPGTFLAFALFKLRHAFQQERRARGGDIIMEGIGPLHATGNHPAMESQLHLQDCRRILLDALVSLPDKRQGKAILLKFMGGLSDGEIASRLDTTAGNVRVLRCRGLQQLRKEEHLRDCLGIASRGDL